MFEEFVILCFFSDFFTVVVFIANLFCVSCFCVLNSFSFLKVLNIFQYICEATGAVLATGALSEIFDGIKENVDACVFQNGHIDYDKLDAESFDRDMPIKFDKLRMKLEAAARQKYDKAITFEFSQNGGTFIFGARCLLCQQIAFESLEVLFHPYALLFSLHEGF